MAEKTYLVRLKSPSLALQQVISNLAAVTLRNPAVDPDHRRNDHRHRIIEQAGRFGQRTPGRAVESYLRYGSMVQVEAGLGLSGLS
jgi:hypothetical protein